MLVATIVLVSYFNFLPASKAQTPAPQAPTTAMATQDNGRMILNVVNHAGASITALLAIGTRTFISNGRTNRSVRLFDSVLNPYGPKEIPTGQSYTFTFF